MPGVNISKPEVTNVDTDGIWLLWNDAEYFLPYDEYPWFAQAILADILDVVQAGEDHLHWPKLDVDLTIDMIKNPQGYPLTYR